ncbi:helix-turn-helix domain-containing protein [Novosphingobium sp. 11B]
MSMKDVWIEEHGDADFSTLGSRLAWARDQTGLKQQELGAAIGKTRSAIAQYESGAINPPLDVIIALSTRLGLDPQFLAFGDDTRGASHHPIAGLGIDRAAAGLSSSTIGLPAEALEEWGLQTARLVVRRLDVEAPHFGIKAGSYLILKPDDSAQIQSDGDIYALNSSAGLCLVRSIPVLIGIGHEVSQLIGGYGQTYESPISPQTEGKLVCVIQRQ